MSPPKTERPKAAPHLEIQVHPSSIRRGVWYFFLSRRQVQIAVAGAILLALFVFVNLVASPRIVGDLLSRNTYRTLIEDRQAHGERLQTLVARLGELRESTEELHLRMSRIFVAYGLSGVDSVGQGFPFQSREVPESIFSRQIQRGLMIEARVDEQLRVLDAFVNEVLSFEEAHGDQVLTTPSISPMDASNFVLTSPFGTRRSPFTKQIDFHPGIDLAAPEGTPIYAPADGRVVFAGRMSLRQSVAWWRYGNLVALRNGDRFITLFGHCSEVLVNNGQQVAQGDIIAKVGSTGWSTSPHLHYEVRARNDEGDFEPVDPRIYILDHRWRDEEQLLVRARRAPEHRNFEPLPSVIGR